MTSTGGSSELLDSLSSSIPRRKWLRGQELGRGAAGTVYQAFFQDTGSFAAAKQVPIDIHRCGIHSSLAATLREVKIMTQLPAHPNIVKLLSCQIDLAGEEGGNVQSPPAPVPGAFVVDHVLTLFTELQVGGSVGSLLRRFGPLPEVTVRNFTRQMLLGLEFLHGHGIMHRDIKGGNVLVSASGEIKLADFGTAIDIPKSLINEVEHQLRARSDSRVVKGVRVAGEAVGGNDTGRTGGGCVSLFGSCLPVMSFWATKPPLAPDLLSSNASLPRRLSGVPLPAIVGDKALHKCVGTPLFMAPEVIQQKGYNSTADIWSLGCTVIQMLTGKPPWSELGLKRSEPERQARGVAFRSPMPTGHSFCVAFRSPMPTGQSFSCL